MVKQLGQGLIGGLLGIGGGQKRDSGIDRLTESLQQREQAAAAEKAAETKKHQEGVRALARGSRWRLFSQTQSDGF